MDTPANVDANAGAGTCARGTCADPRKQAPFEVGDYVNFAGTLITILLVHESGHYLMCLRHRVSATLPYFLPAPPNIFPLGTFGAFIRIRSRFHDRRALFDIGAAGPWAGFVVALIATAVGLRLSTVLPVRPDGQALELGDSLLTAFLRDPEPYLSGVKDLVAEPLGGLAREAASRTNWTLVILSVLGVGSLLLGLRWSLRPRRSGSGA